MRFKYSICSKVALGVLAWSGAAVSLPAITVSELQKQLAAGPPATVIDIRQPALFTQSHIPGAINVPASLCAQKKLPPLGRVIVYDAGLGRDATDTAALELGSKPGITVDVLDGGFAAWESSRAQTTEARGAYDEKPNRITYAELKALKATDVVLVDLRSSGKVSALKKSAATNAQNPPLTDLAGEFPGLQVSSLPFGGSSKQAQAKVGKAGTPPLLVLIDNGDGQAESMARTLMANGTRRYVILSGGELILSRHGQSGLQRSGPGSQSVSQSTSSSQATP